MIAGNPDTFAVITEKVANWHTDDKVSGMLHVCINGVAYPRKPRATDVENNIISLFDEQTSAFSHPKVSRKLFEMKGKKLFKRLSAMRFPQYYSGNRNAEADCRFDAVFLGPATAGYHVFVLTYQVDGEDGLLVKNMEDFARALRFIRGNENKFHVHGDKYITCGFSAGGYLICLWNTNKGFIKHDLPKPQACFPVYPGTSMKIDGEEEDTDPEGTFALYGCSYEEAAASEFEIPEHAEHFPSTAIFLAADDELVDPMNSRMLASALDRLRIPCRLEIGPEGGHGFADGTGMCMAGWTERAVRWYESLEKKE